MPQFLSPVLSYDAIIFLMMPSWVFKIFRADERTANERVNLLLKIIYTKHLIHLRVKIVQSDQYTGHYISLCIGCGLVVGKVTF